MKKQLRRQKSNFIVLGIIVVATLLFIYLKRPEMVFETDGSYNLLTINAVFAGFVYSMLSQIIELSEKKTIRDYDKAGYLSKYYGSVYLSLLFLLSSIFVSMGLVFFSLGRTNQVVLYIEKILSIYGIIYFGISSIRIMKLINWIRSVR